jgi:hypothetical protein
MKSNYLMAHELVPLNNSQGRAIERLCDYIAEGCSDIGEEQITCVELTEAAYGGEFWLRVKTEYVAAPNTLLSALSNQWWFVLVGKRGGLTAHQYPQSYKQFINARRRHHSGCRFVK